jgi:peptide/nickel transport system substrate-binding protein
MLFRRGALAAALLTVCTLTAGCFAGAAAPGGERLRVVLPFPPTQAMSPWGDDGALLTRLGIAETLVQLDEQQQPKPMLAEGWVRRPDSSWHLKLRGGVRFHDDTPLTAENAALALNKAAQASPVPRALKGIGLTARAEGELDLVVSTAKPDAVLPQRLSSVNLVILAPGAYQDGGVRPLRAGTGPFVLTEQRGTEGAALEAFGSYRDGRPALSGVDVRFVPDGLARAAALRAGEADVAAALPISSLPAAGLREVPLPRTVSLYLNTAKAPFTDPALRGVVRAAVEREALARGVYEGRADVANGLFRSTSDSAPPAEGRASGQKIVIATTSDRAELPEVATAVAESLRRRGFEVEQVVSQYSRLEPDLLAGRFDAVIMSRSYALDSGDAVTYLASDFSCAGGYNVARLCDPEVDAAITAAANAEQRVQAAAAAEAKVIATGAVVPLVHERAFIGLADRVAEVAADPAERQLLTRLTHR